MLHARPNFFQILALALAASVAPAPAQHSGLREGQERCYGVALRGENDGIGKKPSAGGATRDYQGDAWVWVEQGECTILPLPDQADGTPRRGAPVPLERDRS